MSAGEKLRVVFMGTPEFAVPSLNALCEAGYDVVGVFTQPDRPAGRGNKLTPCPVKLCALERGLDVYQFEKVKTTEGVAQLRALKPDVMVTAAFGQILTKEILDIPGRGTVNVHASLLPKHRGSAPINWCIIDGDRETGVTLMLTDIGIDTGDILASRATPIGALETAGALTERLSVLGAELLADVLPEYLAGKIIPVKQDEALSSYEPMLKKTMGDIDWTQDAETIANRVRGLNPWPCADTAIGEGRLKIWLAQPVKTESDAAPGTVIVSGPRAGLVVKCGVDALELLEIQAPNARRMAAKAYLMGKKIDEGTVLGKEIRA